MPVMIGSVAALVGGAIAGVLALGIVLLFGPKPRRRALDGETFSDPRRFVFRQGYLVELSDNVGFLLPKPINYLSAWDDLIDSLADITDDTVSAFEALRDLGRPLRLEGQLGRDRITVLGTRNGEDIRISVVAADADQSSIRMDVAGLTALEAELDMLTRAHNTSTTLSWTCDSDDQITWGNSAYLNLLIRCQGPDAAQGWPLSPLFPNQCGTPSGNSRRQVIDQEGQVHWFEVTSLPPDENGVRYSHAVSLAAAVQAEDERRAVIQTLTKTFAFMPTGIAIFDSAGRLAQFNPALMDMSGLEPQWLSRQPRLTDFLDALREKQRLPEPRNYKAWRDAISELGQGETASTYHETWTLPSGLTYRMTVRPHSDSAVTILFEDVSADVSATQAARQERSMLVSILENTNEALLAFDADGSVQLENAAARDLWRDGSNGRQPMSLDECIHLWSQMCHPSPVWGDLRSFAREASHRAEWTDRICPRRGVPLDIRVIPLPENRMSISFLPRPDALARPTPEMAENLAAQ